MDEKWYDYWWFCVHGISNKKKTALSERGLDARQLFQIEALQKHFDLKKWMTEEEMEKLKASRNERNWEQEYVMQKKAGIRIVTIRDLEYPKRLKALPGMPFALAVKGKLPEEEELSIAIVGARNCTHYGEIMTLRFAERLAEAGAQIISGMARGVDGAAHRGALNVEGDTFAVLGCGVDVCYPKEHQGLYNDIQKRGGILSEYAPGTAPYASNFPARNRILSGLSDVVLVMEAKEKSGSLITADMALEQGRDVYALPGPIDSSFSKGCHQLIRQGAGILIEEEDLLEELHIQSRRRTKTIENRERESETDAEKVLYNKLGLFPKSREELLQETKLQPQELVGLLVSLELKGMIREKSKNHYVRSR